MNCKHLVEHQFEDKQNVNPNILHCMKPQKMKIKSNKVFSVVNKLAQNHQFKVVNRQGSLHWPQFIAEKSQRYKRRTNQKQKQRRRQRQKQRKEQRQRQRQRQKIKKGQRQIQIQQKQANQNKQNDRQPKSHPPHVFEHSNQTINTPFSQALKKKKQNGSHPNCYPDISCFDLSPAPLTPTETVHKQPMPTKEGYIKNEYIVQKEKFQSSSCSPTRTRSVSISDQRSNPPTFKRGGCSNDDHRCCCGNYYDYESLRNNKKQYKSTRSTVSSKVSSTLLRLQTQHKYFSWKDFIMKPSFEQSKLLQKINNMLSDQLGSKTASRSSQQLRQCQNRNKNKNKNNNNYNNKNVSNYNSKSRLNPSASPQLAKRRQKKQQIKQKSQQPQQPQHQQTVVINNATQIQSICEKESDSAGFGVETATGTKQINHCNNRKGQGQHRHSHDNNIRTLQSSFGDSVPLSQVSSATLRKYLSTHQQTSKLNQNANNLNQNTNHLSQINQHIHNVPCHQSDQQQQLQLQLQLQDSIMPKANPNSLSLDYSEQQYRLLTSFKHHKKQEYESSQLLLSVDGDTQLLKSKQYQRYLINKWNPQQRLQRQNQQKQLPDESSKPVKSQAQNKCTQDSQLYQELLSALKLLVAQNDLSQAPTSLLDLSRILKYQIQYRFKNQSKIKQKPRQNRSTKKRTKTKTKKSSKCLKKLQISPSPQANHLKPMQSKHDNSLSQQKECSTTLFYEQNE